MLCKIVKITLRFLKRHQTIHFMANCLLQKYITFPAVSRIGIKSLKRETGVMFVFFSEEGGGLLIDEINIGITEG